MKIRVFNYHIGKDKFSFRENRILEIEFKISQLVRQFVLFDQQRWNEAADDHELVDDIAELGGDIEARGADEVDLFIFYSLQRWSVCQIFALQFRCAFRNFSDASSDRSG